MEEYNCPELLDIFTKIVCDNRNYCYVCLRTEDERRLVTPHHYKNFAMALQINTNGKVHHICHICERQAHNALKLLKGATFAPSIRLILNEYMNKSVRKSEIMFEKKLYNRILRNTGLSDKLTPKTLGEELKQIRKYTMLSETDTLVMDNKQVYEVAPVEISKIKHMNNTQVYQDAIIECPIMAVPESDTSETSAVLPDNGILAKNDQNDTPYIILDEDDDPLKESPEPTSNYVMPQMNNVITNVLPNLATNLIVTTNPPQIVKFEDLMRYRQTEVNFLLHPVFLETNGSLTVPSLSASFSDGNLIIHDTTNNINTTKYLGINTDIIKQNLSIKNEVFVHDSESMPTVNYPAFIGNVNASCQTDSSCQPKKMRIDDNVAKGIKTNMKPFSTHSDETKTKRRMNTLQNVTISEISSDLDNIEPTGSKKTVNTKSLEHKTDWEDKIPMDVISFVDAVDPNADATFRRKTTSVVLVPPSVPVMPVLTIGPIRSLINNKEEIIDLS